MFLLLLPVVWDVCSSLRASIVFRNHRFVQHIISNTCFSHFTTLCISGQLIVHKAYSGHTDSTKFNKVLHKFKCSIFNFSVTSFLWGLITFIFINTGIILIQT